MSARSRSLTRLPRKPGTWTRQLASCGFTPLPALVSRARPAVTQRIVEFFGCRLRNRHTRHAYAHAVARFFDTLANKRVHDLHRIRPTMVAAYIDDLERELARPSVKQHLAAIRMLFDWLVIGGALAKNPAASVRGPKFVVKCGKTPVLNAEQARQLLNAIDTGHVVGLRDRALIAVMLFGFARVGAVVDEGRGLLS